MINCIHVVYYWTNKNKQRQKQKQIPLQISIIFPPFMFHFMYLNKVIQSQVCIVYIYLFDFPIKAWILNNVVHELAMLFVDRLVQFFWFWRLSFVILLLFVNDKRLTLITLKAHTLFSGMLFNLFIIRNLSKSLKTKLKFVLKRVFDLLLLFSAF